MTVQFRKCRNFSKLGLKLCQVDALYCKNKKLGTSSLHLAGAWKLSNGKVLHIIIINYLFSYDIVNRE